MIFSYSKCRNACRRDPNLTLGQRFDTLKRKNHLYIYNIYHTDSINTIYRFAINSSKFDHHRMPYPNCTQREITCKIPHF